MWRSTVLSLPSLSFPRSVLYTFCSQLSQPYKPIAATTLSITTTQSDTRAKTILRIGRHNVMLTAVMLSVVAQ